MKYDTIAESYINLVEENLLESRIDYIKKNAGEISTEHDPQADHKSTEAIVDHLASTDPTKKKLYTNWLVNQYKAGNFKQEDAYRITPHLETFDKHKSKIEKKDINQYNSVDELKKAVEPHIGTGATKAEVRDIAKQNLDMPGHELKYDDDKISIYHLSDQKTSQKIYGRSNDKNPGIIPTDWCTASQNDNHCRFDYYTKKEYPGSKIHVVHRKSDGAVFQYHPESNQFMDKNDEEIKPKDFLSISDSLHKAWDKHPELV